MEANGAASPGMLTLTVNLSKVGGVWVGGGVGGLVIQVIRRCVCTNVSSLVEV